MSSVLQWWLRFDDPMLGELVTRALRANTDVRSAQAALRQARALRDVAAAALSPGVDGSISAQRSKTGHAAGSNSFKAGLDANWDLDIFGADRSALEANDADVRASAAMLGNAEVSIAAEVGLNYIALRSAQTRLSIATENLASQEETLQITRWRLQAGLVSSLDLEQARTAAAQTRAQLPVLQTAIEQASFVIAVLTGQPPADLLATLAPAMAIPRLRDEWAATNPAATLRRRPDVLAAEHEVTAASARVAEAEARRAPTVHLGGTLGLSSLTLGALATGASIITAVLGSVSVPVFDGGAGFAQVQAQLAAWDKAQVAYQATVLTALREVEDAIAALRGDRERLLRLRVAAEAASGAALMARQRYGSGLIDFQVVLETQRTQLNTQDAVVLADATVSTDHVRLFKALGGAWEPATVRVLPPASVSPADLVTRTSRP